MKCKNCIELEKFILDILEKHARIILESFEVQTKWVKSSNEGAKRLGLIK